MDDIYESLGNKRYVAALFFDLFKAFDTIDRKILLDKLYHYGIRVNIFEWFKSYLSLRSQFVELNGVKSSIRNINFGVPQGSVLGPLLFLIYINDIGNIPNLPSQPKFFADDTNLFVNAENISDLNISAQHSIDKLSEWMTLNKLTINQEKTVYMIFSPFINKVPITSINLYVKNCLINKVDSIKFLGLTIDDDLTFRSHISDLTSQLKKFIGIFYKLSFKLPISTLKILYFSLIHSKILYAIEIYANTYATYLHDLFTLNNRLLRIIQHRHFKYPIIKLYAYFTTLPIPKLYQKQLLLLAHKLFYNYSSIPPIFHVTLNAYIHDHFTRRNHDFHRTQSCSYMLSRMFANTYSILWNSLPHLLKLQPSYVLFKTKIQEYLAINI